MLVLDASFCIPLFVPEPRSEKALSVVRQLRSEEHVFLSPTLWAYEVTSTLQKLRHFKHITNVELEDAIDSITTFEISLIQPDINLINRALAWSQRLQRASAYDSFYLALAEERGCDLWTVDTRLVNAAKMGWVQLLT